MWYVPAGIRAGCELEATRGWQVVAATSCSANAVDGVTYELYPRRAALDDDWGIIQSKYAFAEGSGDCANGSFQEGAGTLAQDPGQVRLLRP